MCQPLVIKHQYDTAPQDAYSQVNQQMVPDSVLSDVVYLDRMGCQGGSQRVKGESEHDTFGKLPSWP